MIKNILYIAFIIFTNLFLLELTEREITDNKYISSILIINEATNELELGHERNILYLLHVLSIFHSASL